MTSGTTETSGTARTGADTTDRVSGLETWRIAATIALGGALLLLLTVAAGKWVMGEPTQENPQIIWMAPAALVLALALPAAVLALGRRRWPRIVSVHVVIWVLSFLAFLNYTLYFTRLNKWAVLLLAAGAATQLARWLSRRPGALARVNRRVMPAGYVALAVAALGLHGWWAWTESRNIRQLPPAAPGSPNVVLLILDTVRAASMSLYGYPRTTTPVLDSLARHAVVFDRAFATAPWTLPSHASMMTGYWPHQHGATWHVPLDDAHRTLAEELASRGYRTGGFVANLTFTAREYGMARGFAVFRDFKTTWDEVLVNAPLVATILNRPELRSAFGWYDALGRKLAPDVTREFLEFVDDGSSSRPFFAFLNYMDAHDPYLPPAPFDTLFGPVAPRHNEQMRLWKRSGGHMRKEDLPPQQIEGLIAAYDGAIARLDHEIGLLVDSLRVRGLLDNTVLIVSSDHGEFFGEHGLFEHAKAPFVEVIHVPLLVLAPGRVEGGHRVDEAVSLRRIPATVMALLGEGEQAIFPGHSLLELESVPEAREPVLSQLDRDTKGAQEARGENTVAARTMYSLIHGPLHYLRIGGRGERLFDFHADPSESSDLSRESPEALGRMRVKLDSALGLTAPAR